jgi:hypothetical protein
MAVGFSFFDWMFSLRRAGYATLFLAVTLAGLGGCQKTVGTEDPQLKPIQAMLEEQLPPHTPQEKVVTFLDNRGYPILPAQKQGTIVANIRRTDTATVQPVIARVTFYFDANRKLNTFELQKPAIEPKRH